MGPEFLPDSVASAVVTPSLQADSLSMRKQPAERTTEEAPAAGAHPSESDARGLHRKRFLYVRDVAKLIKTFYLT